MSNSNANCFRVTLSWVELCCVLTIMITEIVATNIVASRPSKWQLTATPNARANKNRGGNISNTKNADFFIATTRRFYIIYKLFLLLPPPCHAPCLPVKRLRLRLTLCGVWGTYGFRTKMKLSRFCWYEYRASWTGVRRCNAGNQTGSVISSIIVWFCCVSPVCDIILDIVIS